MKANVSRRKKERKKERDYTEVNHSFEPGALKKIIATLVTI